MCKTKNDSFIVNVVAICCTVKRWTNYLSSNRVFNYIRNSTVENWLISRRWVSRYEKKEEEKKEIPTKRESTVQWFRIKTYWRWREETHIHTYTNKRSNSTGGEFTRQRESRGLVCPWKFSSTCLTLFTRHWTELSLTVGMVHDSQQEQRANDREDLKLNLPPRMEGSLTKYEMDMEGRNRD